MSQKLISLNSEDLKKLDNILCQLIDENVVDDETFQNVMYECRITMKDYEKLRKKIKNNLEVTND